MTFHNAESAFELSIIGVECRHWNSLYDELAPILDTLLVKDLFREVYGADPRYIRGLKLGNHSGTGRRNVEFYMEHVEHV